MSSRHASACLRDVDGGELGELHKTWRAVRLLLEDAIERDDVLVRVEAKVRACALHHRDGAALQLRAASRASPNRYSSGNSDWCSRGSKRS